MPSSTSLSNVISAVGAVGGVIVDGGRGRGDLL